MGILSISVLRRAAVFSIVLAEGVAQAADKPPGLAGQIQVLRYRVNSETQELNRAASEPNQKQAQLRTLAERRERAMLALMQASPEAALQEAFAPAARSGMPEEVRKHIEEPATRTGTLELLGVLAEDGRAGLERHLIASAEDLRLAIELPDEYLSGTRLTIRGLLLGNWLAAATEDVTIDAAVTAPETNAALTTR